VPLSTRIYSSTYVVNLSQTYSHRLWSSPSKPRTKINYSSHTKHVQSITDKMEELYHRYKTNAPMDFIFTTNTGQVVEVKVDDLPTTSPYSPNYDPKTMAPSASQGELPAEVVHYLKSKKLQAGSLDASATDGSSDTKPTSPNAPKKAGESTGQCSTSLATPPLLVVRSSSSGSAGGSTSPAGPPETVPVTMVYNEYGELVSAHSVLHPGHSKDMSKLQILRIIKKGYHHNVSFTPATAKFYALRSITSSFQIKKNLLTIVYSTARRWVPLLPNT
jgi:hypothetical protein